MKTLLSTLNKKCLLIAQAPQHFYRDRLLPGAYQIFLGPDIDEGHPLFNPSLAIKYTPKICNEDDLISLLLDKHFLPDFIFIKADATQRTHIKNISSLPGKKILLMGDTHHLKQPLQTMLHYAMSETWDLISSEHDRHHLPLFAEAGLNNLIWLPCFTMNPHKHQPQRPLDPRPVFVGSLSHHHQYRQRLIQQLRENNIPLIIQSASQQEAAKLYNSHSISLNVSLNGDLNFRIMEVLAAGGCLLTDRLGPDSGLHQLFTEGVHYLGYSSAKEAAYLINILIDNPKERMKIAEAGFQRFWSCCSPEIQCNALLSALNGFPIPDIFQAPK